MAIRVTGMYSGLDTESIISELVSAKSMKKQSLVKAQTKLSWKQDAWKALNTKIYNFYANVLDNLRYQGSYTKKTTKVSNSNAITVTTSDSAVNGTRSVKVNQLAKGAKLTGGSLVTSDGIRFTGGADLKTLRKYGPLDDSANLSGSFRVKGDNGAYVDFEVNENTTINDIVRMIQSTGLNCNYDEDSQRLFISSKLTGAINNFNIMANDEGGYNALAALGLLSADDVLNNKDLEKWAGYTKGSTEYDELVQKEIESRRAEYTKSNEKLTAENDKLAESNTELEKANTEYFTNMIDNDDFASAFKSKTGKSLKSAVETLYDDNGLYDQMRDAKKALDAAKADESLTEDDIKVYQDAYDAAKSAYDTAKKEITDVLNEIAYGPLVPKKDEDGNIVYEQVPVVDGEGKPVLDENGKPTYEDGDPVMVRDSAQGLEQKWKDAKPSDADYEDLKKQVDSLNKWYDAVTNLEKNKASLAANNDKIEKNNAQIDENNSYLSDDPDSNYGGDTKIKGTIEAEFDARIAASQKSIEEAKKAKADDYDGLFTASKVDGQDAEIIIDGAKFTSMTNTISVNGLTLTANEVTDKEITITTSTDTDGIYDMIKNFFKEYNSLINEMNSLYNAEASTGYEPLTSEEKEALSDSEVEEWEKKIKDSLLRRDSTLSSVSFAMVQEFLKGVSINGKQYYLSDFGINTLGYFEAADNERNAYHIDGDADDDKTKANDNVLKSLISSNPDLVMNFFTGLANNLYDTLTTQMSSTNMSSAFTVYNDKQMKNEYNDYTDKIKREEEKLNALMDKWYEKFSKMEVALSKLESRSSSLASILGG